MTNLPHRKADGRSTQLAMQSFLHYLSAYAVHYASSAALFNVQNAVGCTQCSPFQFLIQMYKTNEIASTAERPVPWR